MRGMSTSPQGNQELLVVRDKVGRPPGELGVSKSMGCDISLQCFDIVSDSKMADRSDVFALYLLLSQFCWELCFGLLLIFV